MSSHSRETPTKQVGVSLTVDQDRVKEDATKVMEKTTELAGKVTEDAK